ncbi:sugar phosphate isomerase/epimerase family protein [Alkalicoccobacillus murimartini]|uniref:Sugar phosphate isomerase/epimerase n=1 Tax=Alkalicoccobacillus murimartini TaxID=171685 RepID=A0ABT9YJV5_9BACI|nr:sugar phosphate isomerase/epimerase [Alkalicoccobacillus murimartini]MDQ0208147.1 sugar phosphate isomerase/epimerase [Alkalicoccobacillus murimartini]
MKEKFAAQLYTLREEMKRGIAPVFAELKQMGWAGVQLSALPEGHDPDEIASYLKKYQLGTAGVHVGLSRLETDLEAVLKETKNYNTVDIVCPFLSSELRTIDGYKKVKQTLNALARDSKGFRISYHNHDFEFKTTVNNQSALEFLLEPSVENEILAEIDVYWVKKAGIDPLTFIQPYTQRMPLIHLKDITKDAEETFAELGTGQIDFKPILQWGERSGVEWYIVEQDLCEGDPMKSLEISLQHLNECTKAIE